MIKVIGVKTLREVIEDIDDFLQQNEYRTNRDKVVFLNIKIRQLVIIKGLLEGYESFNDVIDESLGLK